MRASVVFYDTYMMMLLLWTTSSRDFTLSSRCGENGNIIPYLEHFIPPSPLPAASDPTPPPDQEPPIDSATGMSLRLSASAFCRPASLLRLRNLKGSGQSALNRRPLATSPRAQSQAPPKPMKLYYTTS